MLRVKEDCMTDIMRKLQIKLVLDRKEEEHKRFSLKIKNCNMF